MAVPTYTASGAKATTAATLDKNVFDVEVKNHELLKQAYVAYQANGRENLAKTLKRGEVRGGGKKPWKQKGTGRARFGSIRVPIWRGGGITFGPLGKENYSKGINKKAKVTAVRQALTLNKANTAVVESFEIKSGKTVDAAKILQKLGATRRTLIITDNKDEATMHSISNLSNITLVQAMYLNVFDILNADMIIITKPALPIIEGWLGKKADKATKDTKEAK